MPASTAALAAQWFRSPALPANVALRVARSWIRRGSAGRELKLATAMARYEIPLQFLVQSVRIPVILRRLDMKLTFRVIMPGIG